jgi:hypothetical protein
MPVPFRPFAPCFLALLLTLVACGGGTSTNPGTTPPVDASDDASEDAPAPDDAPHGDAPGVDAPAPAPDVATDTGGPPSPCSQPPPRRLPCAGRNALSTALPATQYGALEGELVAVTMPGSHGSGCVSDSSHVHLQVAVGTERYDVAIDTGAADGAMFYLEKSITASPLAAGWSATGFDYVRDLGVGSTAFARLDPNQVALNIQKALTTVSRLTIHGRSYTDSTGVHDVHHNGHNSDGVLLLHGQGDACADKAIALHFISESF